MIMKREEITNSQDYKATGAALEWWKSLPLEVRREQEKQPDIVDAYADGVIYGWNNPHWIPVEESLPPLNKGAVLTVDSSGYVDKMIYTNDGWENSKRWCAFNVITHWMSLPQPPRKEE